MSIAQRLLPLAGLCLAVLCLSPSLALAAPPMPGGFAGDELFVGRTPRRAVRKPGLQFGVDTQVVPFKVALTATRDAYVRQGVTASCAGSRVPNCEQKARAVATEAMRVLETLPPQSFDQIRAAVADPKKLAVTLKAAGLKDPAQVQVVTDYVARVPPEQRTTAVDLVRYSLENEAADLRLEPYVRFDLPRVGVRLGLPLATGLAGGEGQRIELGNLHLDAQVDWQFRSPQARYAVSAGLGLYLPTGTGDQSAAGMADLFQAPAHLRDRLTLAPHGAAGVDLGPLALHSHLQLVSQHRVQGRAGTASSHYLQGGVGAVVGPHFPVALVAEVAGLAGLHGAEAYQSVFAITGVRLRLGPARLGVAAQMPLWDGAKADLGTYQGADFGSLARVSVLTQLSLGF